MTFVFKFPKPDDFHVHLRRGNILEDVAYLTARHFKRATIMPNPDPPVLTALDIVQYRRDILYLVPNLEPQMTFQVTACTTRAMVAAAKEAGAVAGKIYPQNVTTNSQNGVSDFKALYPALDEMQNQEMLVLWHGESPDPGIFCLNRETAFFHILWDAVDTFPRLRMVLEHITSRYSVDLIKSMPDRVAATITPHHLMLTLDDVVGGFLSPHNFCKPIPKYPEDRAALLEAATSGNPKFFLGTDSAPHLREKKECASGCAGVFNAPVAISAVAESFDAIGRLKMMPDFVSGFGADHYRLPRNTETIRLEKKSWIVPPHYHGIVPFLAGKTLHFQVAE